MYECRSDTAISPVIRVRPSAVPRVSCNDSEMINVTDMSLHGSNHTSTDKYGGIEKYQRTGNMCTIVRLTQLPIISRILPVSFGNYT
jgi:hypothetical protein